MDNESKSNFMDDPEFNSDSKNCLPEYIRERIKEIKEFDTCYLCNKEKDRIFCTFRPDQVVILLIALSRFAEAGRTKTQIKDEEFYFFAYDDFASQVADRIWQQWFCDLIEELEEDINDSALDVLPKIVTKLLALYSEDKLAYYSLVNRNWRMSPLLKLNPDSPPEPAEIDIVLAALMNLENKGYTQPQILRSGIEQVLNQHRSQEPLYYNELIEKNTIESGVGKIVLLQLEQIHNWPCHANVYWNEKTHELHWSKLGQTLNSHPYDFNNYPPLVDVYSQYSASDYKNIKKLIKGLGLEEVSFSHSYPELKAEEYEKLTSINNPAEEEHIYAQAGWRILSRKSLF